MQSINTPNNYTCSGQVTNGTPDLCNTIQSSQSNKSPTQPEGCVCNPQSKWGAVSSGITTNGYPLFGCN